MNMNIFPHMIFYICVFIGIILFIKVLIDRLTNKEDDHYSKEVDK